MNGPAPAATAWWRAFTHHPTHGALPAMLLGLTLVSGVVDAVSILSFGRVFVANMTGNVVFLGFALVGAAGFSLAATVAALLGFLFGAFVTGIVLVRGRGRVPGQGPSRTLAERYRLLRDAVLIEAALLAVVLVVTVVADDPFGEAERVVLSAIAAVAMGVQGATARAIAVPDLPTTVLTSTMTGMVADLHAREWPALTRRVCAVLAMFAGAAVGAVAVLHASVAASVAIAVAIVVAVGAFAAQTGRRLL